MNHDLRLYYRKGKDFERSSDSVLYHLKLWMRLLKDIEQDAVGVESFRMGLSSPSLSYR